MMKKILFIVLVIVIVAGAGYSYKKLDFGGKTTILFKIAFGDQSKVMRPPPKLPPQGGKGDLKPPEGFKGSQGPEFKPAPGRRGQGPPPGGKGRPGKPGMGKIIYLGNVIPYFFILAFFILITRVLDVFIRKVVRFNS